jgi:hypothetical protein
LCPDCGKQNFSGNGILPSNAYEPGMPGFLLLNRFQVPAKMRLRTIIASDQAEGTFTCTTVPVLDFVIHCGERILSAAVYSSAVAEEPYNGD